MRPQLVISHPNRQPVINHPIHQPVVYQARQPGVTIRLTNPGIASGVHPVGRVIISSRPPQRSPCPSPGLPVHPSNAVQSRPIMHPMLGGKFVIPARQPPPMKVAIGVVYFFIFTFRYYPIK